MSVRVVVFTEMYHYFIELQIGSSAKCLDEHAMRKANGTFPTSVRR